MLKFKELNVGDTLVADSGFTCMSKDEKKQLFVDEYGDFYVTCTHGKHYMDGQIGNNFEIVGFKRFKFK